MFEASRLQRPATEDQRKVGRSRFPTSAAVNAETGCSHLLPGLEAAPRLSAAASGRSQGQPPSHELIRARVCRKAPS